jgi:carboxylate-amine ligase
MPERSPWARWNAASAERPWTVGVEEEVMLLDARTRSIANRIDDVLAAVPAEMAAHASAETHACVVELKTAPHATVADVATELAALRPALDCILRDELGLHAAAAGTHPLAIRSQVAVTSDPRHREIAATMGALAHREPTMALHVHIAVPDGATAVRALDGLRDDLPLLLALSANSPFWRRTDSAFASMRTPIFSMFPRVGIPRHFGSYARYVGAIERMLCSVAIPDPRFRWWDARLQPLLGTVGGPESWTPNRERRTSPRSLRWCSAWCAGTRTSPVRGRRGGSARREPLPRGTRRHARRLHRRSRRQARGVRRARRSAGDLRTVRGGARLPGGARVGRRAAGDPGHARQRRIAARKGRDGLVAGLVEDVLPARRAVAA